MSQLISQAGSPGLQPSLGLDVPLPVDAYDYGVRSGGGTHGLVLTKPHVVDLILDLAGYCTDRPLASMRLLEPACGHGAFLVAAVDRLLTATLRDGIPVRDLTRAIQAYDIEKEHVWASRAAVIERLGACQIPLRLAEELAGGWVRHGDFLLANLETTFDAVVGNPPYIRIEQLSARLQSEYRGRFRTLYDRADLYVAFIEKGLHLLAPRGVLAFICADRWTLNKYGAPLRSLIAREFKMRTYLDLHRASPFESEVIAYPSIFAIGRERLDNAVLVGSLATASREEILAVRSVLKAGPAADSGLLLRKHETWFSGDAPWVLSSSEQLAQLRSLEARFPLLEADGQTVVRIGVATGRDAAFIVPTTADIESDRMVPLVMREDLQHGGIRAGQRCVLDTSRPGGGPVDLRDYPRLAAYLESHREHLLKRHVAKKNAAHWYKTIDRVYPEIVSKPKLLIPDIAGANEVVYDEGGYYPHHNLYFILSDRWDLEVLGGLLSSRVALFFVWSYAVKMRGGYLRFQAQYLRRIRVPKPESMPERLCDAIREAFRGRDFKRLDDLAVEAYGLSSLPDFDFSDSRK
ncbi:MAG: TaqI-like C-terminal specificity domain-containing protein [Geothrix sp.]|nr:TaqI-like C-terminal specificity domain-containing protein [Geothrix sp.]